jgi:filamentous hemagglutinin
MLNSVPFHPDPILHSPFSILPKVKFSPPGKNGYTTGSNTVNGVDVKVVVDEKKGRIVSGYPTNTPKNPKK